METFNYSYSAQSGQIQGHLYQGLGATSKAAPDLLAHMIMAKLKS